MKKTISLLLALAILCSFVVCAHADEGDAFLIENPELVPVGDGLYTLDFKLTCLYPEKPGQEYPTLFIIYYVCLDADDTAIQECQLSLENISYGDKYKASAQNGFKYINQFSLDEVKAVKFTGYGACTPYYTSFNFNHPPVFRFGDNGVISVESGTASHSSPAPQSASVSDINAYLADYMEEYIASLESTYPGVDFSSIEMPPIPGMDLSGIVPGASVESAAAPAESVPVETVPVAVSESEYFSLDALCVDDSYRDEDDSPLRRVYLFYTFKSGNSNAKISPKYTYLTINGNNEYESTLDYEARKFIKNYYHSNYLETVYLGDELKVMASFKIPEADLAPGRTITVKDSDIPDYEKIVLSTDDIQHFNGVEEIAEAMDPEGYAERMEMRAEADAETARKVKNIIANRRYWCFVNNLEYTFEFYSGDKWAMFTEFNDVEGTYSVRNGYIFCTNSETGHVIEIPWNWEGDLVNLDTDDAMDVG